MAIAARACYLNGVLRVIALLFALQLSGLPHVVADVVNPTADHCQPGCEDGDKNCSPLCTTCSCTHTGRPIVAGVSAVAPEPPPAPPLLLVYAPKPPPSRPLPSLFRPPRA